jgi:hypothetical protein
MHTDATAQLIANPGMDIASRRILRLALGVSLCMLFSQAVNWPLSFLAPVFTIMLLSLPYPAPSFKGGLNFVFTLMVALFASNLLMPFIEHAPMVGVLLLALGLFGSFFYTAMGGSALRGTFVTIGLTLLVTIGSVSIDAFIGMSKAAVLGATVGVTFVWLAHALVPDPPPDSSSPAAHHPAQAKPDRQAAARSAFRSLLIVFPVALLFLCWSASSSYIVVIIKLASLGQQATADKSRSAGRKMIESTAWGGVGAIVAWTILSACPNLAMYTLLIALAGLLYGPRIFKGEGMHPKGAMWSYAFLTMIIVLAPTVGGAASGKSAAGGFWFRQAYFLALALYSSFAVAAFDAFWPGKQNGSDA